MKYYLVYSHDTGSLYFLSVKQLSKVEIEEDCETCGDHDQVLGVVKNADDIRLVINESNFDFYEDYVEEIIAEFNNKIN